MTTQPEPVTKTPREKFVSSVYDAVSIVTSAIIAIMVVFTFLFRFVGVVGPSMEPTLFRDNWLAVSAFIRQPKYGDIVVVTQPNAFDEPIVKRVIAVGGQTVDIRDGHVYVNGEQLTEKYISSQVVTEKEDITAYPLTIPQGFVFVLGDNRPHSTDSRSALIGMIDNNYVLGRVVFRLLPFGEFKVGIEYN
ncbi:MAG: signal peptidase I [Oscillospiraceae bacterium]|nr:signal peptidase I [Oscillospiraceae bacterium]